jgi:putative sterol carrier protein
VADSSSIRDVDAAGLRCYLDSAPAEDVVAVIRATGDEDLLGIIRTPDLRRVFVEVILRRLPEYAVGSRVATVEGTVRFDLTDDGPVVERHAVTFGQGRVTPVIDVAPATPVDVVLATSVLRFLRLVSGERNAGLEYLGGTLDIDGDAGLAIDVGGIFPVPGTDQVAMDPTMLDPVDVATLLSDVSAEHLRAVMTSDFRPVVLGEIFRRLPEYLNRRRADGVTLTIAFRLLGNPSGAVDRYVVRVADGVATVEAGDAGGDRDATVTCEAHDYLRLATGHLNPVVGVLKGALKVKGDKAKALKLSSIIDIPTAR